MLLGHTRVPFLQAEDLRNMIIEERSDSAVEVQIGVRVSVCQGC